MFHVPESSKDLQKQKCCVNVSKSKAEILIDLLLNYMHIRVEAALPLRKMRQLPYMEDTVLVVKKARNWLIVYLAVRDGKRSSCLKC